MTGTLGVNTLSFWGQGENSIRMTTIKGPSEILQRTNTGGVVNTTESV